MPPEIHVHLLPDHLSAGQLQGSIAVVVDVLRASTTILTALHNGAAGVIPCRSISDAEARAEEDSSLMLGGERRGVRIEGFDLGNSPADYGRETVAGRFIAFTTTNGTRALLQSVDADEVLIGAFVNVQCLAAWVHRRPEPLHIICAGTDGDVTGEDPLFAGCLIDRVLSIGGERCHAELSDLASMIHGWWQFESARRPLSETLTTTRGGRNLLALSAETDIELSARFDSCPVLARFDGGTGLITL